MRLSLGTCQPPTLQQQRELLHDPLAKRTLPRILRLVGRQMTPAVQLGSSPVGETAGNRTALSL